MKIHYLKNPQLVLGLILAMLSIRPDVHAQGCTPPNLTGTTPGSRCGTGTMTLGATGDPGATLNWYAAATGGSPIGIGSVFTTPAIGTSTSYYVSAGTPGASSASVGPLTPASQGTVVGSSASPNIGMMFDVLQNTTLVSVDVFPVDPVGSIGTVSITTAANALVANVSYTTTVSGGNMQRIILNVPLTAGADYKMYQGTAINLNRYASTMVYPYNSSQIKLTKATGFATNYYGYFYNWQMQIGCESPRVAVTASVTPAPALTISSSASLCVNAIRQLSVTSTVSDYNSYTWSPASGLYTDAAATVPYTGTASVVYHKPIATGNMTYTVNGTNSTSGCANLATTTLTATAPGFTASLSPAVVCSGAAVTLSATAGANTGNYTWQWNPGALNASTVTVNPVSTGTAATNVSYTVNVNDPSTGCTNSRILSVTVNNVPTMSVTGTPSVLCGAWSSATLTAAGTSTAYAWSNGATAASVVVTPSVTTNYTVTGTNSCGTKTLVTTVAVGAMPVIIALSSSSVICVNNSVVLTASATAGATYSWSTGSSAPSITVSPAGTTTYTVTGSNACGTVTATVLQVVSPCTGLEDMEDPEGIRLYPNPAGNYLSIRVPSSMASDYTVLEVTDALGKLVIAEKLSAEVTTLRLAELKDGLYMFRVIRNHQPVKAGKIIKQ